MSVHQSCHAIDFGTSNSLLAHVSAEGMVSILPLESDGNQMLRSLIYTPHRDQWYFGQEAVRQYREQGGEGRFFKSVKKFLPEPGYSGTVIHERKFKIEELIATILRVMRERANRYTGEEVSDVMLGRPALYSLDQELDRLAEGRMRSAARLAGYRNVRFCPEPLAAGLDFKGEGESERLVLVCDFGGGTSDFTLLRLHPGEYVPEDVLGLSGIFLAGDALDGIIMQESIAPHFGKNVTYRLPMSNNFITFPRGLLSKMCSPAHITHLKERDTWEFLKEIRTWSVSGQDQRRIDQLFALVENQLGWPLFGEIERAKIALGTDPEVCFRFFAPGIEIEEKLKRMEFFQQACATVDRIMDTMLEVFRQSGTDPSLVDEICLTGGTAQSPLLRERFKQLFGEAKLKEHKVYQSVVAGLGRFAWREYIFS
ncbi:MAG: Hsp70 family protein [Bdellovibrio sp.]|nr:Hsp70 family protein [Bdellovibrio sp.]